MKKIISEKIELKILLLLSFSVIIYFAFHYLRVTNFPIGDDPAHHIANIRVSSYKDLLLACYPIPLLIFKLASSIFHLDNTYLFVFLICSFFALAGIALVLLTQQITKSWLIAVVSGLVFITSRWANDGLRMGLLAETFGWGILLLTFCFLLKKNIPLTILFSVLLFFSHPFSLIVFIFTLFFYSLTIIFKKDSEEELDNRKKIIVLLSIYTLSFILLEVFAKSLVSNFLSFGEPNLTGYSERGIYDFFFGDDKRRLFLLFPIFIGIASAIKNWHKSSSKFIIIFLLIGFFLSFNHKLGISFLVFRFYPYFEMALAILIAIGFFEMTSKVVKKGLVQSLFMISLVVPVLVIQFNVNKVLLEWQSIDVQSILMPDDRDAIKWIGDKTSPEEAIVAPWKIAIWIPALTDKTYERFLELSIDQIESNEIAPRIILVQSKRQDINKAKSRYHIVYKKGNTIVYEHN